jgi:hypothetical protein
MQLDNLTPVSIADWIVTISDSTTGANLGTTYWTSFSGVEIKYNRPTFADGLSAKRRKAATGTSEVSDCSLSKPFDPVKDGATALGKYGSLVEWILAHSNGDPFDLLIRPVKRSDQLEYIGTKAISLSTCRLMSFSIPDKIDMSAGGDSVSMISLSFSVEDMFWKGVSTNTTALATSATNIA